MDLDERRVDVEIDRTVSPGGRRSAPGFVTHLCSDLVEGSVQRRVRRHVPEQVALGPQMFNVGTALAPTGQHQGGVDQDLAAVVQRGPFTRNGDALGEVFTEPQAVGKIAQCMEPDVGDDLVAP
jgi:hypothetical protein